MFCGPFCHILFLLCSHTACMQATVWFLSKLMYDICVLFHALPQQRVHSKGASNSRMLTVKCVFFINCTYYHLVVLFDVFLAKRQHCQYSLSHTRKQDKSGSQAFCKLTMMLFIRVENIIRTNYKEQPQNKVLWV